MLRRAFASAALVAVLAGAGAPPPAYHPIDPTLRDRSVMLDGRHLSVEDLVAVARHGARVVLDPAIVRQAAIAHGLVLEAAAEGIPVYGLNTAAGALRGKSKPLGQPESEVPPWLNTGVLPEVADEDIVRAMMVIGVNTQF